MVPEIDTTDIEALMARLGDTTVDQPLFRMSRHLLGAVADRLLRTGAAPADVKALFVTLTDAIVEQSVDTLVAAAAAAPEPAPSTAPAKLRVIAKPALRIITSKP